MNRRKFISDSCITCAAFAGGGLLISLMESCSGLQRISASNTKRDFEFPISSFGEKNVLIIQRNDAEFDALVVKKADNTFLTLEMKCSHQNQPLNATNTGLYCASHGSRFSLDGEVLIEPATAPLHKYKTEIIKQNIIIHFNS